MAHASKRKKALDALVDKAKTYSLDEALALVKQTSTTKFDAGVELHIRLGVDPKQADQTVRGTIKLPEGTGKQKKIVVFAEGKAADDAQKAGAFKVGGQELVKEIAATKKFAGDVAVATPEMMRHIGTIAKILGPKGLMPNPKNETVTPDVAKAVKELSGGKIPFRNDDSGNIHMLIGKASFSEEQLKRNITAIIESVRRVKPASSKGTYLVSIHLSSSMGPSIRFSVS